MTQPVKPTEMKPTIHFDARPFKPETRLWGPAVVAGNLIRRLAGTFDFAGIGPNMPEAETYQVKHTWPAIRALDKLIFESSGLMGGRRDLYWGTNGFMPALGINCPSVLTVHDALLWEQPGDQRGAVFLQKRAEASMRRAHRILVDSKTSADGLLRLFPSLSAKMEVALLGHEFSPHAKEQAPTDAARFERPFLLMLGAHRSRKNLGFLLKVLQGCREKGLPINLCITGGIDPAFEGLLQASPGAYRLGYLAQGELIWLMKRALCLAFPSTYEGFGLPLLEAMTYGCPVLASDIPIHREIGGEATWALPLLTEAWIDAVAALYREPERRQELIAKGAVWSAGFTWERTAKLYGEAFTEALGRG